MRGERKNQRLRVAFMTIHPAPYHDPTLTLVHRRKVVDIEVMFLFEESDWHPYWGLQKSPFPSRTLNRGHVLGEGMHFDHGILHTLKKEEYDVVCISGYMHPTLHLALLYCLVTGTSFVWIGDSILWKQRPLWRQMLKWLPMQLIARTMGAAWVPGKASREYMIHYGAHPGKIFEGCYCIDAEAIAAQAERLRPIREKIRRRLGFSNNDLVFLFVGRMIPVRGIPHLMETFRRLSAKHPEIALMVIGDGPVRSWAENFAWKHKLERVEFLQPVPFNTLTEYYVASDAYVQPSISEPYSLATAQAATCALPLVLTDQVGAAADYLIEGETGYLAKAGSTESLVQAMEKLIADRTRMVEMGLRAQELAMRRTMHWAATQFEEAAMVAAGLRPIDSERR